MTDPTQSMGPTPNDPTHDPANDKQPDTLRDARLAHALRHMPDAHMQPSAQSRSAVLQEAMRAVGGASPAQPVQPPVAQRRWWHAWLGQPGQRVPWGAAVASLAVFGFITVMWYGQEVPDAAPQRSPVVQHPVQAEAKKEASADTRVEAPVEAVPNAAAGAATPRAALPARALAKPSLPAAPQVAPPAPSAPSVAAPAAAVAVADAPQADVQLERRSKALQAEVAVAPAKALADTGPVWVLTIDGVQRRIGAAQAQHLLAQLRGLAYGPVTAAAPSQAANQAQEHGVGRVRAQQADTAIRLESAGQEQWLITPGAVTHYLSDSGARSDASAPSRDAPLAQTGAPLRSSITPAQYAALRGLAVALGTQPP